MDHALAWGSHEQGTIGTRSAGCSPSSRTKPILYRSRTKTGYLLHPACEVVAVSYDRRWLTYGGSRHFGDGNSRGAQYDGGRVARLSTGQSGHGGVCGCVSSDSTGDGERAAGMAVAQATKVWFGSHLSVVGANLCAI